SAASQSAGPGTEGSASMCLAVGLARCSPRHRARAFYASWLSPCNTTLANVSETEGLSMTPSWLDSLLSARVYDLAQPPLAGTPTPPAHKPGYFYGLHRRHRDTYQPQCHGPRSSASGTLMMMEHTGTHIDALSHQANDLVMFGGVKIEAAETPTGFTQL